MFILARIKRQWHCFWNLHNPITLTFIAYEMGHVDRVFPVLLCECGRCFNPEIELELPAAQLKIVSDYVDNLKENHGVKNPTMGP